MVERSMTSRNDFTNLNRAVEFEQKRKDGHLLALHRRTRIQEILAKGAVLVGLVLAVDIALVQMPGLLARDKSGSQGIRSIVPPAIATAERDAAKAGEVTNYTLFRQVPSELTGFGDVVTGSEFSSSADTRPAKEFCYVERLGKLSAVSNDLYLATVPVAGQGSQAIPWSAADLAAVELSRGQALGLLAKCRFLDPSARAGVGAPA